MLLWLAHDCAPLTISANGKYWYPIRGAETNSRFDQNKLGITQCVFCNSADCEDRFEKQPICGNCGLTEVVRTDQFIPDPDHAMRGAEIAKRVRKAEQIPNDCLDSVRGELLDHYCTAPKRWYLYACKTCSELRGGNFGRQERIPQ